MADVVRPASSGIRLARKWSAFSCGIRRPLAIKAGSRERAEEATFRSHSLDHHKIFLVARSTLDCVDLNTFEQVRLRVTEDSGIVGAEIAGEISDRHASAIDLSVITAEEEVHVFVITNDLLVNGTSSFVEF